MEERAGYIGEDGRYHFDEAHMRRHRAWEAKQKKGARFVTLIKKESPMREQSQLNAHWERCTILGDENGVDKRQVSNWLMQDAYTRTQNPAFGEYKKIMGNEYFIVGSVAELDKQEVWELKRAAYEKLQALNEDREPNNWALFPERGAGGVILKMCARWDERPRETEND
jgi:hypothetical protein